ncbi:DUF6193 family natural product biosynthesis protein [Streptomyces sp. ICC1]|uniref:DUF6193 family natural product biosynthesis protein n=1 Tax=Streptomyces sp. ICC1 TaxID=2099583 RepID=UPI001EF7D18B|nr:DUF6193 family natural product biosynthesis protein [Streptomyces sp. ICC1]
MAFGHVSWQTRPDVRGAVAAAARAARGPGRVPHPRTGRSRLRRTPVARPVAGDSVYWLRFSSRPTPPIVFAGLPSARALAGGRYEVRTSDGRLREAEGTAGAVDLLVAALPADVPAA